MNFFRKEPRILAFQWLFWWTWTGERKGKLNETWFLWGRWSCVTISSVYVCVCWSVNKKLAAIYIKKRLKLWATKVVILYGWTCDLQWRFSEQVAREWHRDCVAVCVVDNLFSQYWKFMIIIQPSFSNKISQSLSVRIGAIALYLFTIVTVHFFVQGFPV